MNALYSLASMAAMVLMVYLLWAVTKPEGNQNPPEHPEDVTERTEA
jgi:hypothetical protein